MFSTFFFRCNARTYLLVEIKRKKNYCQLTGGPIARPVSAFFSVPAATSLVREAMEQRRWVRDNSRALTTQVLRGTRGYCVLQPSDSFV
jgi:hypothetical protein